MSQGRWKGKIGGAQVAYDSEVPSRLWPTDFQTYFTCEKEKPVGELGKRESGRGVRLTDEKDT